MYIKLLLATAMLMTLFACDSEQVKKIKEKVKESTSKVSSGNDEKESLFDEEQAKKFIKAQLPKIVTPVSYEFEAEKVETEKYGEHISIKYLVEVSYNDDYYNVDKSTSFIQILKDKGWTNEFAKLTKTPFVFFTKVNNKGEKTAMKGSMLYRLSGEKMAYKDHQFLGGKITKGYPKNKFKDGYLMIGSKEADAAIDSYMANFDIAKRHMENVMRTVETGKEFEGYLKINSQLKKAIILKMGTQHKLLKSSLAQIIFDENPSLVINLKGTYITEIRPADRSNVNYKVDSVNLYKSPRDPFFQQIHPVIKNDYFNLFLSPNGNLSGKSKYLSIDLKPSSKIISK